MSVLAPEHHDMPLGWNPLSFLQDLQVAPGVRIMGFVMGAAVITFVLSMSSRQKRPFFSFPLFLALMPLIAGAFAMFMRVYRLLAEVPFVESDVLLDEGRRAGYAFQFGLSVSLFLIFAHALLHVAYVKRRFT